MVVIWCAMLAAKKGEQVRRVQEGACCPSSWSWGSVSLLILLEPNLSMAVLVALLGGAGALHAAGAKIGHFMLLGVRRRCSWCSIRSVTPSTAWRGVITFLNPGDATTDAGIQIISR